MIITIDGPSGTGKTTIAKGVAERLGILYFDTGAMYRAVSLLALRDKIDLKNENEVERLIERFSFRIERREKEFRYFVGNEDVTEQLRHQEINDIVSEVAALPRVREVLWALQRSFGEKHSAVFEGRDMGSVVFRKPEVKIFLTASPEQRALRCLEEMREKQPKDAKNFDLKSMEQELIRRDEFDSRRALAPLKCPKGAHTIDTTNMGIDEIIEEVLAQTKKAIKRIYPGWLHSKTMGGLYRTVLFIIWCIFKLLYRLQVHGLEHYFRGPAIIAPNHTSYLDPPIVSIAWPEELHFLAKESLFKIPLFGRFIRLLNSHPVHGGAADVTVFKTILKLLSEGKQINVFPEGRRSFGELASIKPGIGLLLSRSKTAIIPTYIHGADKIWGRERKFPKLWGKIVCIFGSPILWETFASLEKRKAQEAVAEVLTKAIKDLKAWYESGARGTPP